MRLHKEQAGVLRVARQGCGGQRLQVQNGRLQLQQLRDRATFIEGLLDGVDKGIDPSQQVRTVSLNVVVGLQQMQVISDLLPP